MSGLNFLLAVAATAAGLIVFRTRGASAAVQKPIRIEVHADEDSITRSR